jgi:tRNA-2-methylthio-N6-dimethylallyladenosine synthase
VVQRRYERLTSLVEKTSLNGNQHLTGREVEVLVADGEGRKDAATLRMSGRARDNRLVHFAPEDADPRPGDVVRVLVTRAAPHYLIADGPPVAVRRTPGGDAWSARRSGLDGSAATGGGPDRVLLGLPGLGRPA